MTIHEQLIAAAKNDQLEKVREALAAGADPNYANQHGDTALLLASNRGHTEVVRLLLEKPEVNVTRTTQRGNTALILASYKGHTEVVRLLLEKPEVNVNHAGFHGGTALTLASKKGHTAVVRLLLEKPEVNVNHASLHSDTALTLASYKGHTAVVRLLLEKPEVNVNDTTRLDSDTALVLASDKGHTEVVRLLLEKPEVNVNHAGLHGDTALIAASNKSHTEVLRLLLAHPNIDIYHTTPDGKTALNSLFYYKNARLLIKHAVQTINNASLISEYKESKKNPDRYSMIKYLIQYLINKTVNEPCNTDEVNRFLKLLNFLLSTYNDEKRKSERKEVRAYLSNTIKKRVNAVIAAGDIESLQSEKEKIALICSDVTLLQKTKKDKSEKTDKVKIMKLIQKIESAIQALKEKEASLKNTGRTLMQALRDQDKEKALALIEDDSINLNDQDVHGNTALHLAAQAGYLSVITQLLNKNANVNLTRNDGATPLYLAARYGYPEIVSLLLAHNADENLKHKGLTPLGIAAYEKHPKSITMLLKHAAAKGNNYQNLINAINDVKTVPQTNVFLSSYYEEDLVGARKNIQEKLVTVLKERTALVMASNHAESIHDEINALRNIKSHVNLLEKTTKQAIKALITELKAKQIQLEMSAIASPANAAICLTLKDGINQNDLAHYLLNTEMSPDQSVDLLNALKGLSTEQFDHLKQALKAFVSTIKGSQAFSNDAATLRRLFREQETRNQFLKKEKGIAPTNDLYNTNPFLFILRTGTSEYKQKNTDSFNTVKHQMMGYTLVNAFKNAGTFFAKKQPDVSSQNSVLCEDTSIFEL